MKVLKIGAVWCNGCVVMRPRWQEVEQNHPELETEYYEFDDSEEIIEKYNIEKGRLPTFIFLDSQGEEIDRKSGELSVEEIEDLINKYKDK